MREDFDEGGTPGPGSTSIPSTGHPVPLSPFYLTAAPARTRDLGWTAAIHTSRERANSEPQRTLEGPRAITRGSARQCSASNTAAQCILWGRMVRRAFLGLLATIPVMLATMRRAGRSLPLNGLDALPPPQALGTCDMFLDAWRDFADTHTWLAAGTPVDLTGSSASMVISSIVRLSHYSASSSVPGIRGGRSAHLGGVAWNDRMIRMTKAPE